MSLTIELPHPLDRELAEEAKREGIPPEEHAALLVVLTMALLKEQNPTPFQEAVKSFLADRALDTDAIASAFEELARQCLHVGEANGTSSSSGEPQADAVARSDFGLLGQWRNGLVHGVDVSLAAVVSSTPPLKASIQASGRLQRGAKADKGEISGQHTTDSTNPARKQIHERPPNTREAKPELEGGNAAAIALLQSWLEEDATDDPEEIRKAQEELDEFKRAINQERERAGARRIYP